MTAYQYTKRPLFAPYSLDVASPREVRIAGRLPQAPRGSADECLPRLQDLLWDLMSKNTPKEAAPRLCAQLKLPQTEDK